MAGINFLYEEYKKDPQRIEKLLNGKIEISEKLDGSRFQVQNDESNTLTYYKRRDVPISKIDRTLSKYYEKAMLHFENLSEEKISQMPEGWRFGMEYFPNLQPVTIVYDKLPLNNLVLTDIQVKDPRDRTVDLITDKQTLKRWADILEVENPPIIFEGSLTDSQKSRILTFLNTPYTELVKRFKTESFTSFILTLLNPELKNSFLSSDLSKDIDGLIFRFDGKEAYRVSNPEIAIKKQEKKEEKPSDIYNLTLVFLQEFLTDLDFKRIKLKNGSFEEKYIDFISQTYNKFLQTSIYKTNFEKGVDFELPKFLTREESEVNFGFVKNPETLSNLQKSNTNRELFKIMLASMRSHKKKPTGFFTKELILHHNQLVDKIADYVGGTLKEATFYTYQEFKSVYLAESESWEEFGKEPLDEIEKTEYGDFPTYNDLRVLNDSPPSEPQALTALRRIFAQEENADKPKKKTKICLMKGKFQPFHNGHYTIASDAEKETGMKVILAVTNKKLPKEGKFSESLHRAILDEVVQKHPSIKAYFFTDGRSLGEISRDIPDTYEIGAFAGSPDECEDVKLQLGKEFPTFPLTKHMSSQLVLQKLKDEDYEGYKKLVPSSLHNHFYKIKNELSL
jgi:hypothetical protein